MPEAKRTRWSSFSQSAKALRSILRSGPARASFIYLISNSLNAGIQVLLLPILTRYLSPHDYGMAAMFQAIFTIAGVIIVVGLRNPIMRALVVGSSSERADYLTSCFAIMGVISAVLLAAALAFGGLLSPLTGLSRIWVIAATLSAAANSVVVMFLTWLQAQGRSKSYGATQLGLILVNVGISLVLVVGLGFGWTGRVWGVMAASFVGVAVALAILILSKMIGRVRKAHVADALPVGLAAAPHSTTNVLITYADRFFLNGIASTEVVGLYVIASQLSLGLLLFGQSLHSALLPWAFRKLSELRSRADLLKLLKISVMLTLLVCLITAAYYLAIMLSLRLLVAEEYLGAWKFFPWLLGGAFFNVVYFFFCYPLFYYRRVEILSFSGFFILLAAVVMMYVFSRMYGAVGVAMALFGARFLLAAVAMVSAVFLTLADIKSKGQLAEEGA